MKEPEDIKIDGLYGLKKKIILIFFTIAAISIVSTMIIVALILRKTLINDNREKSRELAVTINSSLKEMMMIRSESLIQNTINEIARDGSILRAFIMDRKGKIIFSSADSDKGRVPDMKSDPGCSECHGGSEKPGIENSIIIEVSRSRVLRSVSVIYNEKKCFPCHPGSLRINGKLVIDRSIKKIDSLIVTIEMIMFFSALASLIFLFILISWGANKFISKILLQYNELNLLYSLVESLSRVIDINELKEIILNTLHNAVKADEVAIITPLNNEYRVTVWSESSKTGERIKINPGDPMEGHVKEWVSGGMNEEFISRDKREFYYPVRRKDARLALIYLKRYDVPFDLFFIRLIRIIGSHISVAFENAFLYKMAITDELTGLSSLRHFKGCLIRMISKYEEDGETGTLLMIDIDNFKSINDTYGHLAGDSVLKEITRCVFDSIRDSDMAFRYGGEELTVILPSTVVSAGIHVAERIRKRIWENTFLKDELNLKVTISIGLANCPENAVSSRELLNAADVALYEAKKSGKNITVLSSAKPDKGEL